MIRLSTNIEHSTRQRPKVCQSLERHRYCVSLALLIILAVCSCATQIVVANAERQSAEGASVTILERARIAPTAYAGGRLYLGEVNDPTSERMGGVAGHAGLFSTADDLALFAK
jgi:hypothetical protein